MEKDINYWIARCAMLEQELDMLKENFCQYDQDTNFMTPNFTPGNYVVNKGKKEYLGYIYDEFIKDDDTAYYVYSFILVNNKKIIAMGKEEGRSGGITCSCKMGNFKEMIKKSPVYDKVKHLPIASENELEKPIYKYFSTVQEYEQYFNNQ